MGGSWENNKKTSEKSDFSLSKPQIVRLASSILYTQGRCLIFYCYIPKTLSYKPLFCFSKCWFFAKIQWFKVTLLLQVKSKVPISWAWSHLYFLFMADGWNFCDIFLKPQTKSPFLFFKILSGSWENHKKHPKNVIFRYQNHKLFAWPLLYFLFMENVWKCFDTFLRP